jgi:SAM-dependent methyltransferase
MAPFRLFQAGRLKIWNLELLSASTDPDAMPIRSATSERPGSTRMADIFKLPARSDPQSFGRPIFKRNWTRDELVAIFPDRKVEILDIGAGRYPFESRNTDQVTTIDFDRASDPIVTADFSREWPFEPETFDFVYASHVIEHLYPQDRDKLIVRIFRSLRSGGLLFIRVPHKSSFQGTGWEHHSLYSTNGVGSLTHGQNPYLPQFELLAVGLATGDLSRFHRSRSIFQTMVENILNKSFRLTDQFLCLMIGGVPEVQFLLRKP